MTDRPTQNMKMTLLKALLTILPQKLISYINGWFFRLSKPKFLVKVVKLIFIKITKIDLENSLKSFDEFDSVQSLFTRKLKSDSRPFKLDSNIFVQPADGKILSAGSIGEQLKIKGVDYRIFDLIFGDNHNSSFKPNWHQITYLSPKDYHRVHCPCDATLVDISYHSGRLWTVAPSFVSYMPTLFSVNERLVFHLRSNFDNIQFYLVMVGSLNVGRMSTRFVPTMFTNNCFIGSQNFHFWQINQKISKMDELGIFNLGSTVAIFADIPIQLAESLNAKSNINSIKVGENMLCFKG